jgi:CrcB protein
VSAGLDVLAAVVGGGGAATRFVVDGMIRNRRGYPLATLVINVSGSFVLGVLTGLVLFHGAPGGLTTVAGVGFCGGYTTFSTASFETVRLLEQRRWSTAALHTLSTAALTVAAAAGGVALCLL